LDSETTSLEILKKFEMLMTIRYIDDKGVFQPGLEISVNDTENLNKLLENSLHWKPLQGRTSAGHAVRILQKAKERLQDEIKEHGDPTVNNNSDLEIIEKTEQQILTQMKTIQETAAKLNLNLSIAPQKATASTEDSPRSRSGSTSEASHPSGESGSENDEESDE
jgi:hypothetical protein